MRDDDEDIYVYVCVCVQRYNSVLYETLEKMFVLYYIWMHSSSSPNHCKNIHRDTFAILFIDTVHDQRATDSKIYSMYFELY